MALASIHRGHLFEQMWVCDSVEDGTGLNYYNSPRYVYYNAQCSLFIVTKVVVG